MNNFVRFGLVALVAPALIVGCGNSTSNESSQGSNESQQSTSQDPKASNVDSPDTTSFETSGSGEVASAGGDGVLPDGVQGSRTSPLHTSTVAASSADGNTVVPLTSGQDLCATFEATGVGVQFEQAGVSGLRYLVSFVGAPYGYHQATVVCSTSNQAITSGGEGPGDAGVSVACPSDKPRVRTGTAERLFTLPHLVLGPTVRSTCPGTTARVKTECGTSASRTPPPTKLLPLPSGQSATEIVSSVIDPPVVHAGSRCRQAGVNTRASSSRQHRPGSLLTS